MRSRDRVVAVSSKSGCLRVKSFERKNTGRAQVVQRTAICEQPDSLSGGVRDVLSPESPERRSIAGIAVTFDGGPVLSDQGCLAGVAHADFAQALSRWHDEDAQNTVTSLRRVATILELAESRWGGTQHLAWVSMVLPRDFGKRLAASYFGCNMTDIVPEVPVRFRHCEELFGTPRWTISDSFELYTPFAFHVSSTWEIRNTRSEERR